MTYPVADHVALLRQSCLDGHPFTVSNGPRRRRVSKGVVLPVGQETPGRDPSGHWMRQLERLSTSSVGRD